MTKRWADLLSAYSSASMHAERTLAFRILTPLQILLPTNSLLLWKMKPSCIRLSWRKFLPSLCNCLIDIPQSTPTMLLQSQQRLKREADKARQLAAEREDELASAHERMERMQAELKGVKDAAREQLLELEQLKTVQCSPFISRPILRTIPIRNRH